MLEIRFGVVVLEVDIANGGAEDSEATVAMDGDELPASANNWFYYGVVTSRRMRANSMTYLLSECQCA